MKLDGAPTETGVGDPNEVEAVKRFMTAHPNLKGLIAVTPTETYMADDPVTLGYLTAWPAHYLLTGHRFRPGAYRSTARSTSR